MPAWMRDGDERAQPGHHSVAQRRARGGRLGSRQIDLRFVCSDGGGESRLAAPHGRAVIVFENKDLVTWPNVVLGLALSLRLLRFDLQRRGLSRCRTREDNGRLRY